MSDGFAEFGGSAAARRAATSSPSPITDSNETAVSGSDYDAVGGTLNFAPGQTVQTVRVPLINDTTVEAKEDFLFNVFNASNAVVGNSSAMATIIDNDAPSGTPVISIGNRVVDNSSGEVTFAVTLNRPSTGVVTVKYTTSPGTATDAQITRQ